MKKLIIFGLTGILALGSYGKAVSALTFTDDVLLSSSTNSIIAKSALTNQMQDVDVAIYYHDGSVEYITNLASRTEGLNKSSGGPILALTNCTAYIMRPIELDEYRLWITATNSVLNGQHNLITVTMDDSPNYSGNTGINFDTLIDVEIVNMNFLWTLDTEYESFTNLTYNPYTVTVSSPFMGASSNYTLRSSIFQLNFMMDVDTTTDTDHDYIKMFVDTDSTGDAVLDDCTFIVLSPNSTDLNTSCGATHSSRNELIVNNCRFISSDNLEITWNDDYPDVSIVDCVINQNSFTNKYGYDRYFGYMDESSAKALLIAGTEQYWTDDESGKEKSPPWKNINDWYPLASSAMSSYGGYPALRMDAATDGTGRSCVSDEQPDEDVTMIMTASYPGVAATTLIYYVGQQIFYDNGSGFSSAGTEWNYVTNSTGSLMYESTTNTFSASSFSGAISFVGAVRNNTTETDTGVQKVNVYGQRYRW